LPSTLPELDASSGTLEGKLAMFIPKRWSKKNLDAVGVLLQRSGSLSIGIALGLSAAHYVASEIFLCSGLR
jgi:hypothetical protein